MNIEIDEQTMVATILFASVGWALYENPQYTEPAAYIAAAVVTGWAALTIIYLLGALTEMMWWDALWEYTRGDSDGE